MGKQNTPPTHDFKRLKSMAQPNPALPSGEHTAEAAPATEHDNIIMTWAQAWVEYFRLDASPARPK